MALISASDLTTWRPITGNDADAVSAVCSATDVYVKRCIGYEVESGTYTERLSGRGTPILKPLRWPITAVSSLTVDGEAWTVLRYDSSTAGTQRAFLPAHGKWLEARSEGWPYSYDGEAVFPRGTGNVLLSYTAGYATVPEDLRHVCIMIALLLLNERSGLIGHGAKNIGDMTVQDIVRNSKDYQFIADVLRHFRER